MLRHLGAAYYESLHGRATRADVTRALDTVEDHLGEQRRPPAPGAARPAGHPARELGGANGTRHHHGWSRRVSDVMTTSVVTVDRFTPYKEVARLLTEHRISGVPVLKMGREVVGVVTEADLLGAQASAARHLRWTARRPAWARRGPRRPARTAGELMTSPAVTVGPHVTVPAAARLMNEHHVRRLPVTSERRRHRGPARRARPRPGFPSGAGPGSAPGGPADYAKGILTVQVGLKGERKETAKKVEVKTAK